MNDAFFLDRICYSLLKKDSEKKVGKLCRGLSKNQICIATMIDDEHAFLMPCGFGKPSAERLRETLSSHIRFESTMYDDGERLHSFLVKEKNVKWISFPTSMTKNLEDDANPLWPINELHRYFRSFMRSHGGYNRNNIENYCNLFAFTYNNHGDLA